MGESIKTITPRHTLKKVYGDQIDLRSEYFFCLSSQCKTVYYDSSGTHTFNVDQLINLVSCKDEAPEVPLCYCYKINKGDVLKELKTQGESRVIEYIQNSMQKKTCFCDKSNPRGGCCLDEIRSWLLKMDIKRGKA